MGAAQPTLASGLTRMMWQTSTTTYPHGRSVWHPLHLPSNVQVSWQHFGLSKPHESVMDYPYHARRQS